MTPENHPNETDTKSCQVPMHEGKSCGQVLWDDNHCILHSGDTSKNAEIFGRAIGDIIEDTNTKTRDFTGVIFNTRIKFKQDFDGPVLFHKSRFLQPAVFYGVKFKKAVSFDNAVFEMKATFQDVSFSDAAVFNSVKFKGEVDFIGVEFLADVVFGKSSFSEKTLF